MLKFDQRSLNLQSLPTMAQGATCPDGHRLPALAGLAG